MSWASQKQNTYIGRKNALLPGSKWGNPSKLNNKDSLSRFKCILDYYIHVTHSDLFFEIYQLCNTTIGCWCYPQICHGDVLIFLINNSIINCKDAISHQSSWNRNVHSQVCSANWSVYDCLLLVCPSLTVTWSYRAKWHLYWLSFRLPMVYIIIIIYWLCQLPEKGHLVLTTTSISLFFSCPK